MRAGLIALLLGTLATPTSAQTRPIVYVPKESGMAWWVRELELRPTTVSVSGISVEQINLAGKARAGMRPWNPICRVGAVTNAGIASIDRETQREIDATLAEYPASFINQFISGGTTFTIRVVAFETCESEPETGFALLISDAAGKLRAFDKQPSAFTRIFKRDDGKINVFGCFTCGEVSELVYDAGNDRFYYEWIGH